jgi:hypothetical protein
MISIPVGFLIRTESIYETVQKISFSLYTQKCDVIVIAVLELYIASHGNVNVKEGNNRGHAQRPKWRKSCADD